MKTQKVNELEVGQMLHGLIHLGNWSDSLYLITKVCKNARLTKQEWDNSRNLSHWRSNNSNWKWDYATIKDLTCGDTYVIRWDPNGSLPNAEIYDNNGLYVSLFTKQSMDAMLEAQQKQRDNEVMAELLLLALDRDMEHFTKDEALTSFDVKDYFASCLRNAIREFTGKTFWPKLQLDQMEFRRTTNYKTQHRVYVRPWGKNKFRAELNANDKVCEWAVVFSFELEVK
jgi:hypothetical protein